MQKFTRDCLPALLDASFQPWEWTQAVNQIAMAQMEETRQRFHTPHAYKQIVEVL